MWQTAWDVSSCFFSSSLLCLLLWQASPALAEKLPQLGQTLNPLINDDTPEEVLRAEIYTDAHSPIDGTRLTAAEYTILMENLGSVDYIPPEQKVSKRLRNVVELLRLRQQVRSIAPFLLK